MRLILPFLTLLLTVNANADVLHRATCAGFLDPRPGKVLDSVQSPNGPSLPNDSVEKSYVIDGRARRIHFVTADRYGVSVEDLPQDRLEVPMVNARLPLPSRRILPFVANVFDANFFRGLKVLFADAARPRVTRTSRRGVTRFTFRVASGASVDAEAWRMVATKLYAAGFGRNATLDPRTRGFDVAIGGKVYSGRDFYAKLHELNIGNVPTAGRVRRFIDFLTGLSFAQIVRNAFVPPGQKPNFRPRFVYAGDAHGDLTPARISQITSDIEDRLSEGAPQAYDVVVAGRTFTDQEFTELYGRMLTDGITSIHAERSFGANGAGLAAIAISQAYTWSIRAAGAALVLNVLPDPAQGLVGATLLTIAAASPNGSMLNAGLADAGNHVVARVARAFAYLVPNYSGLFDSSSFAAVEAQRARTLANNVASALDRHDVNEITIVTNGTRDIERLLREFDARYPAGEVEPRNLTLRAVSRAERNADPRLGQLVEDAERTFAPRTFRDADEFLDYYDPNRLLDVRTADSRDVARAAFYFFRALRRNVPEYFRLNPNAEQNERLLAIPDLFEGYAFDASSTDLNVFGRFTAMRKRTDPR